MPMKKYVRPCWLVRVEFLFPVIVLALVKKLVNIAALVSSAFSFCANCFGFIILCNFLLHRREFHGCLPRCHISH